MFNPGCRPISSVAPSLSRPRARRRLKGPGRSRKTSVWKVESRWDGPRPGGTNPLIVRAQMQRKKKAGEVGGKRTRVVCDD